MKRDLQIPTLATAWERFEREDLERPSSRYDELLRELERRAISLHLAPHMVTLAAELTTFSPHLSEDERAALTMLTLATLVDLSQGSTRTAASGPEGYAHLSALYRALSPKHADGLLNLSRKLLDRGGAPEVISQDPDAYTPLLYLKGQLYQQRLYKVEGRLAERLGSRLGAHTEALSQHASASIELACQEVRDAGAHKTGPHKTGSHKTGPHSAGVQLSEEQLQALRVALSRKLSLISGGPGTGKTSIVVALLRALARLGVEGEAVQLAAPTGKAAWRMGESIRHGLARLSALNELDERLKESPPTPQTLHRLLGYHPVSGRFRRHHNAPIEARVVIIDESSMIDVFLMERLASALAPHTQLILLGDAHQLPSVSAGAVFRDLLLTAPEASVTLSQSYRMRADNPEGRSILSFAAQIRQGEEVWADELQADDEGDTIDTGAKAGAKGAKAGAKGAKAGAKGAKAGAHNSSSPSRGALCSPWVTVVRSPSELTFSGVSLLESEVREQWRFLDVWAARHLDGDEELNRLRAQRWSLEGFQIAASQEASLSKLFEHLSSARLLCLTQTFESGVGEVNAYLHERLSRRLGVSYPFLVGEPVMMLHNDYDRALFNGDQGLVLWVKAGERRRLMVVFPELGGGYKAYDLESLSGRLEPCYAMTVHKSQGSEFKHVGLLLPPRPLPLLSRSLVYTAVTRSTSSVTIVGRGELLSLKSLNHTPRSSGLCERLTAQSTTR